MYIFCLTLVVAAVVGLLLSDLTLHTMLLYVLLEKYFAVRFRTQTLHCVCNRMHARVQRTLLVPRVFCLFYAHVA